MQVRPPTSFLRWGGPHSPRAKPKACTKEGRDPDTVSLCSRGMLAGAGYHLGLTCFFCPVPFQLDLGRTFRLPLISKTRPPPLPLAALPPPTVGLLSSSPNPTSYHLVCTCGFHLLTAHALLNLCYLASAHFTIRTDLLKKNKKKKRPLETILRPTSSSSTPPDLGGGGAASTWHALTTPPSRELLPATFLTSSPKIRESPLPASQERLALPLSPASATTLRLPPLVLIGRLAQPHL